MGKIAYRVYIFSIFIGMISKMCHFVFKNQHAYRDSDGHFVNRFFGTVKPWQSLAMLLTELLRDPVLDLSFISILDELARLLQKIRKFNCQTVTMSFVAITSNLDSLSSAMLKVGRSSTLIPTHSWKKASWKILAGSHHHGQVASYPHRR